MPPTEHDLAATLDHEQVLVRQGRRSGLPIIVALHSTALGPAVGGLRLSRYPSAAPALVDCLRLSRAMTFKGAAVDNGTGGGKTVVPLLPNGPQQLNGATRQALLLDVADLVHSLQGQYITGPDVGTTVQDMQTMRRRTPYVGGAEFASAGLGRTTWGTALGVEHAMNATAQHLWGSPDLTGRTVAIIGFGGVGRTLAQRLVARGALVSATDIDDSLEGGARGLGVAWAPIEDAYTADVDVLAPCALGGFLDSALVARLRCRAVVGAANNQLADDGVATLLQASGVLWAPDFVANAGGMSYASGIELHHLTPEQAQERLVMIETTMVEILQRAKEGAATTLSAAYELAQQRLNAA